MHVRPLRRHLPAVWRLIARIAVVALVIQGLWLLSIVCAEANTHVDTLTLSRESGYDAVRVYAGRTVPGRASELGFRQGGELAALHVDAGDSVAAGDLLAELDRDSLEAALAGAEADVQLAEANLLALEADTQLARQTEARFRRLQASGHVSAQEYDEQRLALKAAEARLAVALASLNRARAGRQAAAVAVDEARIYAPFAGRIQSRYLDEGAQAGPGQPVLRLVETGRLEAHVGIPESMAGRLERDAEYQILWADEAIPARFRTLLPEVDAATRTVGAVFDLGAAEIPYGAVVELALNQRVPGPGYWLPLTALTESDRGLWAAYVVTADQRTERRLVEILHVEAERAFVRGTLNPGEQVVARGVQRLVPGQPVSLAH